MINMTAILVSRQSINDLLVVCICLLSISSNLLISASDKNANNNDKPSMKVNGRLPTYARAVIDEDHDLSDEQISLIVDEFGEHVKNQLDNELDNLIKGIEISKELHRQRRSNLKRLDSSNGGKISHLNTSLKRTLDSDAEDESIRKLQNAKRSAPDEIETRIKLIGTNRGQLPQWSLHATTKNFLTTTSDRLHSASSFVTDKMRTIGGQMVNNIPLKLRKFFRWPSFFSFKSKFEKQYKSLREELYRQMVYLQSSVKAGIQWVRYLLRLDRHLLGATQFADLTEDEYRETFNNKVAAREHQHSDPSAPVGFSAETMAKLKAMSTSGKNVFGHQLPTNSKRHSKLQQHQRSKRDLTAKLIKIKDLSKEELDELNEIEDGVIGNDLLRNTASIQPPANEQTIDETELRLLQEYSDANVDQLDDALGMAEEALAESNGEEPFDLRETGCVLKPDNQADCGVCYAHAVATAARYYNCMDKSIAPNVKYHPLFIGSCGNYYSTNINGCDGAMISWVFNFVKEAGVKRFAGYITDVYNLPDEDSGPTTCPYPRPEKPFDGAKVAKEWHLDEVGVFKLTKFWRLTFDQIKTHLKSIGPVFVNLVCFKYFKLYDAGIYDEPLEKKDILINNPGVFKMPLNGGSSLGSLWDQLADDSMNGQNINELDDGADDDEEKLEDDDYVEDPSLNLKKKKKDDIHSMLIIGYDFDIRGREYYIIWNSHGPVWGNGGFLHIYADALKKRANLLAGLKPLDDI